MKNITILIITCFSILFTISCSKDDDDSTSSSFNPPNWIIGTWLDKSEPDWSQIGGFKFTNDNILDLNANGDQILNYKEGFSIGLNSGTMKIEETSTSNSYRVKIIATGVTVLDYKYSKGSSETIIYHLTTTLDVFLNKQ